jgi:hypothetical protein
VSAAAPTGENPMAELRRRKRGIRDVIVAVISAVMILSPSYLAYMLTSRLRVQVSIVAMLSMVVFLIGVFLLVRLLKD